jgi:hypothetical protein
MNVYGDKFIAGGNRFSVIAVVVDTRDKFLTGVNNYRE